MYSQNIQEKRYKKLRYSFNSDTNLVGVLYQTPLNKRQFITYFIKTEILKLMYQIQIIRNFFTLPFQFQ